MHKPELFVSVDVLKVMQFKAAHSDFLKQIMISS